MNSISIMGRMVADAELRYTQLGTPVASGRVAVYRNKDVTDFFNITFWGSKDHPERIQRFVDMATKGAVIGFTGSMESRDWEDKNGNKRTTWEVNVRNYTMGSYAAAPDSTPPTQTMLKELQSDSNEEQLPF